MRKFCCISLLLACLGACGGDETNTSENITPLGMDSRINIIPAN